MKVRPDYFLESESVSPSERWEAYCHSHSPPTASPTSPTHLSTRLSLVLKGKRCFKCKWGKTSKGKNGKIGDFLAQQHGRTNRYEIDYHHLVQILKFYCVSLFEGFSDSNDDSNDQNIPNNPFWKHGNPILINIYRNHRTRLVWNILSLMIWPAYIVQSQHFNQMNCQTGKCQRSTIINWEKGGVGGRRC